MVVVSFDRREGGGHEVQADVCALSFSQKGKEQKKRDSERAAVRFVPVYRQQATGSVRDFTPCPVFSAPVIRSQ